jgi:hypothetical protein
MSEQLSFYKLFTEKGYSIEIPIIQRDYAQGRASSKDIRDTFLDSLYDYLNLGVPFKDLDFIYGDVDEKKRFIPLDGQQRLTTLFLLHWYLAIIDKGYDSFKNILLDNDFSKFQYKTRHTSTDFCSRLLTNPIDLNHLLDADKDKENELSKTIKDSNWFFLSWDLDPTIQAMLRMLDAIHNRFKNSNGFYDKLTDLNRPVITFQFLALSDYGLTDDLYIKMNSRGKPLTKFENFKARFESHLKTSLFDSLKYELTLEGNTPKLVGASEYFSHKIDTSWIDFFWKFKKEKEVTVDTQLMNFISVIAINHMALSNIDLRKYIDMQGKIPFVSFKDLNSDFPKILLRLFDLFAESEIIDSKIENSYSYNENKAFLEIIHNVFTDAAYIERMQFFAYYMFLYKWGNNNRDNLKQWMRVICNLSNNTAPYNNDAEYSGSIRAINSIKDYSDDIISYLKSEASKNLKGFNPTQIKEERIKAHLLTKGVEWTDLIFQSEKHGYFKGQLISAINFSGIETFFDDHGNLEWTESENSQYLASLTKYINKVFEVFDQNGLQQKLSVNHLFQRAMLSKGVYLLPARSNYSFLVDNDRDISWKRLLQGDDFRKDNRDCFKKLIEDSRFDINNVSEIEKIANEINDDSPDWIKKLQKHPEAFNYLGRYKYIRHGDDDCIYLLKGVKTSGEYTDVFTYSLYLELLKDNRIRLYNLQLVHNSSKGGWELPYISINVNQHMNSKITNNGDGYFIIRIEGEILSEIVPLLEELGFIDENNYWETRRFHDNTVDSIFEISKSLINE